MNTSAATTHEATTPEKNAAGAAPGNATLVSDDAITMKDGSRQAGVSTKWSVPRHDRPDDGMSVHRSPVGDPEQLHASCAPRSWTSRGWRLDGSVGSTLGHGALDDARFEPKVGRGVADVCDVPFVAG